MEQVGKLIGVDIAELRSKAAKATAEARKSIEARYGLRDLEAWQVNRILQAEKEMLRCVNCDGNCRGNGFTQPVIAKFSKEYGVPYVLCKYGVQNELRRAARRGDLPMRYVDKTFDDYEITNQNEAAVGCAKYFCFEKAERGIYLHGATGTGKTFLAALIAREWLLKRKSVVFGDVPSLLEKIKATFDSKGPREDVLGNYCQCDLLILDDIGVGKVTDWSVGVLYQIVNARYNEDKPTVATSNYSLKDLQARLASTDKYSAERIISRLRAMCWEFSLGKGDKRELGVRN